MGYSPLSHNKFIAQKPDSDSVIDTSLDAEFSTEAAEFLAARPQLQLVSEFLKISRGDSDPAYQESVVAAQKKGAPKPLYLSWWSLHDRYDAYSVLDWFVQRADIRQGILTGMCNFPARAGRLMAPTQQAGLIETVIESNDRSSADFDAALRPEDAVVYGPADDIFRQFAQSLPKEKVEDAEQQRRIMYVLAESLMLFVDGIRSGSDRLQAPIMTPIDLRMILGFPQWHQYLPKETLAEVDRMRIAQEKKRPDAAFTTRMEFHVVGMLTIVQSFPFPLIRKIFDVAATRRIRLDKPPTQAAVPVVPAPAPVIRQSHQSGTHSLRLPLPLARVPLPEAPRPAVEIRREEPSQPVIALPALPPHVAVPEAPAPSAPEIPSPSQPEASQPEPSAPQAAPPSQPEAQPSETAPVSQLDTLPEASPAPPAPPVVEETPPSAVAESLNITPSDVDAGWEGVIEPEKPKATLPELLPEAGPAFLSERPDAPERPITVEPESGSDLPEAPVLSEQTPSIAPLGEITRETNYIPDGAFDEARDRAIDASLPPAPKRSGSTSNLQIMRYLLELRDRFGLRLQDDGNYFQVGLTKDIHDVLNNLSWIRDEQRMRDVMINIMHGIDPDEFMLQGDWTFLSFTPLCTLFLSTLKGATVPLLKEAGNSLERSRNAPSSDT